MKNNYINYAGFTPREQSDVMLRLKVLAGEIYKEHVYADYILRQMFPSTATGEYLDRHAAERGLSRRAGTKARGAVVFYPAQETHDDILIPAGTVLCSRNDHHRYTTDSDVVLASDAGYVWANITAAAVGEEYNARGGTITVLVTPIPGIGRVNHGSAASGGSDTESDDALRARLIDSYIHISNSVNAVYYQNLALSVSGVKSAAAVGCRRGPGTVDVYVLGDGTTLSSAKLAEVQSVLTQGRELNVDVRACHPREMFISLYIRLKVEPGYDFSTVAAEVHDRVTAFIDSLGVGRDLLLSEIGEVVYHVEGVTDYKFLESYGTDLEIYPWQFASAENILVREV